MNYTRGLMESHLRMLGAKWPDWAAQMPLRSEVRARNPRAASDPVYDILEYCWTAYEMALQATGDQVIGRCDDLGATRSKPDPEKGSALAGADLYDRVGGTGGNRTLFDCGAEGNLLKFEKWSPQVNDSWILGGVHGQKRFRLASGLAIKNLWNSKDAFFVVTAREVLGLLNFGYKFQQVGPWQCFVCVNRVKAMTADLPKYDRLIKSGQTVEQAMKLVDAEGSSARAAQQVQAFHSRPR